LELQAKHNNLIYAPEFLTAANAVNDYKNSKFIIVGGKDAMCQLALPAILVGVNPDATVKQTDIATASLAKYTINSFLATKVAFMNEIYDVATATNIDYSELSELVTLDSRIGASHMRVPGPDGSRGFAGGCFPKDTEALAYYANEIGKDLTILEKAIESNLITKANQ
jgi:UDPglucose 6-dehydrogenase